MLRIYIHATKSDLKCSYASHVQSIASHEASYTLIHASAKYRAFKWTTLNNWRRMCVCVPDEELAKQLCGVFEHHSLPPGYKLGETEQRGGDNSPIAAALWMFLKVFEHRHAAHAVAVYEEREIRICPLRNKCIEERLLRCREKMPYRLYTRREKCSICISATLRCPQARVGVKVVRSISYLKQGSNVFENRLKLAIRCQANESREWFSGRTWDPTKGRRRHQKPGKVAPVHTCLRAHVI